MARQVNEERCGHEVDIGRVKDAGLYPREMLVAGRMESVLPDGWKNLQFKNCRAS